MGHLIRDVVHWTESLFNKSSDEKNGVDIIHLSRLIIIKLALPQIDGAPVKKKSKQSLPLFWSVWEELERNLWCTHVTSPWKKKLICVNCGIAGVLSGFLSTQDNTYVIDKSTNEWAIIINLWIGELRVKCGG